MSRKLDHNRVTRAKAKRALETDERNVSQLSNKDLLTSAYKEAFRQNYHATRYSLIRRRRKKAEEKRYQLEQDRVDAGLDKRNPESKRPTDR